ncbi:hypothetical protein JCM11641_003806 [Rhodosporidiobolus odoratus]
MDTQALSDGLGLLSIVTWLGAQSPQIHANWKNKSVEGLALPFLLIWFAGDFTNFVGCVLTHQLPFQAYLAAYFLLVDVMLCGQFLYYSRTKLPPLSQDYPYAQPPSHTPSASHHHHRRSRSRKPRRSRSFRGKETPPYTPASESDLMQQSWMSENSIAHSAATSPSFSHRPLPSRSSSIHDGISPAVPPSPSVPERGRTMVRAHHVRTFDPSLSTIHGSPTTNGAFMHPSMHASHVSFDPHPDEVIEDHGGEGCRLSRQRTSSSRSRPPPPSRRSTSVVFLSVGALVTFSSSWSGGGVGSLDVKSAGSAWGSSSWDSSLVTSPKAVQSRLQHPAFLAVDTSASSSLPNVIDRVIPHLSRRSLDDPAFPADFPLLDLSSTPDDDDPSQPPPSGPDWERIIGRAAAWICTTAYLTSRLPQLWQNFRRRSCEGLAMTLFLFAFIGNSLYVASILTNPLATTSPGYLLESTPYLLGSGGTLCFDLAILSQSWLYSEKRKARRERERRRRNAVGVEAEEEAALLDADADLDGTTSADDAGEDDTRTLRAGGGVGRAGRLRPSRRRSTSSNTGFASRSSSRHPPPSALRRSNSTEMGKQPSRSLSRAERGDLADEPFEFHPGQGGGAVRSGGEAEGERRVSQSRSQSRQISASSSISQPMSEEGKSTLTVKAVS